MADPLTVPCPDCGVPTGVECQTSIDYLTGAHADRRRTADLRALEHGTCALCGQPMVRGTVEGSPADAWHPDETDAAACPPIPDPRTDWNGYAEAVNAAALHGHPGLEHFTPACDHPEVPPVSTWDADVAAWDCPTCRRTVTRTASVSVTTPAGAERIYATAPAEHRTEVAP